MILEPDGKNATKEAAAFVRNASDASVKHSIEIRDRTGITTPNDKSLFDVASVELTRVNKNIQCVATRRQQNLRSGNADRGCAADIPFHF